MKSLKIHFEPEDVLILPLAKNEILQGLFYRLLSGNEVLSAQIHNMDPAHGRQLKMFCFSDINGRYRVKDGKIIYTGELSWEIRSIYDEIIDAISCTLIENRRFHINRTPCAVTGLCEQARHTLVGGTVQVSTNTPITVYQTNFEKYREYFTPEDGRFYLAVENNLRTKYKILFGEPCREGIGFAKQPGRETKKCVTRYAGAPITGFYGDFTLSAPAPIIDIAYYCGIGAKNSQGFGAIQFN